MGRAPCCDRTKVKRGPWSPEEDHTLKTYLQIHGTAGNWITLPLKAGLKRCGKSCRLRWLNYLRPDIKHGGFTQEEDNIIFTLHSQMGSRWSLIASHLPGRTDNDVKNYWNTKLKKKLLLYGGKPIPQITTPNNTISPINSTISCSKPFMPCVPNLFTNWDSITTQNSATLPMLSDNATNVATLSLDPPQIFSSTPVSIEPVSGFINSNLIHSSSEQGSSISDSSLMKFSPNLTSNCEVGEDEILMEFGFSTYFQDSGVFNSEDKASETASNWYLNLREIL